VDGTDEFGVDKEVRGVRGENIEEEADLDDGV
jgi:hypothetical protein